MQGAILDGLLENDAIKRLLILAEEKLDEAARQYSEEEPTVSYDDARGAVRSALYIKWQRKTLS